VLQVVLEGVKVAKIVSVALEGAKVAPTLEGAKVGPVAPETGVPPMLLLVVMEYHW
jgi:hypothetical protein